MVRGEGWRGGLLGSLEAGWRWWGGSSRQWGAALGGEMREGAAPTPEEGGPACCPRCAAHGTPRQATMPLVVVGAARG